MKVLAGLCLLGAGCFSLDPLNKPPNILQLGCELSDRPCESLTPVHRGERIGFHLQVTDPDGNADPSSYQWEAFACDTATGGNCQDSFDAQHYDEQAALGIAVVVPTTLPDHVRSISVDFDIRDDRGGMVKPELIFPLINTPTLPSNAAGASADPGYRAMYPRSR